MFRPVCAYSPPEVSSVSVRIGFRFGEPDMEFIGVEDSPIYVKNNNLDDFDPGTGDMRSDDAGGIAYGFIGDEGFQVGECRKPD